MELRTLKPTAEVEFETKDGLYKFTVEHVATDQAQLDYGMRPGRRSDRVREILADAIVGWNLVHDDGTPWPCVVGKGAPEEPMTITAETKANLIAQFVGLAVKAKGEVPEGTLLSLALLEFIRNPENFLKN